MKQIFLWLWCLPQNIIGFLVMLFTRAVKVDDHYVYKLKHGSISLGEFVFITADDAENEYIIAHEKGHREQSRRLGWLYLLIVGIPSIIWCGCFQWYRRRYKVSYYDFYTEKWANTLGGIVYVGGGLWKVTH